MFEASLLASCLKGALPLDLHDLFIGILQLRREILEPEESVFLKRKKVWSCHEPDSSNDFHTALRIFEPLLLSLSRQSRYASFSIVQYSGSYGAGLTPS